MTQASAEPIAVGWVGLGEMGLPMALNLVQAGFRVQAYDIDQARLAAAREGGVMPVDSLGALAAADLVVTIVRTTAQTEGLLAGEGGLATVAAEGRPLDVVVMSTLDPASMRALAARTAGRLRLVDAPVSGGVRGAEQGSLAIMAAGPADALARARPLFDVLGGSVYEVGAEPGLGQAVKFANQVMMTMAMAGTTEALALTRAYGIDDETVRAAVSAGTGASWVLDHWDWMRSLWEDYVPGNALDILIKDIRAVLVHAAAGEGGHEPPLAGTSQTDLPLTRAAFSSLLEAWGLAGSDAVDQTGP